MQDFIRAFWGDFLRRRRGELPAGGAGEAEVERMRLTMALKRLNIARWRDVKDMIREYKRELQV
jgi:hypothetical protein